MAITTLKTRLQTAKTSRVPMLATKAGATPRLYGDTWMIIRRRIMVRDKFTCSCCGAVRYDHQVDHKIPLEDGGTNDDSNLHLLCSAVDACHSVKTKQEQKARTKGY